MSAPIDIRELILGLDLHRENLTNLLLPENDQSLEKLRLSQVKLKMQLQHLYKDEPLPEIELIIEKWPKDELLNQTGKMRFKKWFPYAAYSMLPLIFAGFLSTFIFGPTMVAASTLMLVVWLASFLIVPVYLTEQEAAWVERVERFSNRLKTLINVLNNIAEYNQASSK